MLLRNELARHRSIFSADIDSGSVFCINSDLFSDSISDKIMRYK